MVHPKSKGKPTILAIHHLLNAPEAWERMIGKEVSATREYLQSIAQDRKKRTLFIEGTKRMLNFLRDAPWAFQVSDPFSTAIFVAERNGWHIQPLDTTIDEVNGLWHGVMTLENKRFANNNMREKKWSEQIKDAREEDIVVIHPNHVRGLLIESRLSARSVHWIGRPLPTPYKRLGSRERRRLIRDTIKPELRRKRVQRK